MADQLVITHAQLEGLGACEEQRELFMETFGDVAEVTEENVLKALEVDLDVSWLAHEALDGARRDAFCAQWCVSNDRSAEHLAATFVRLYAEQVAQERGKPI